MKKLIYRISKSYTLHIFALGGYGLSYMTIATGRRGLISEPVKMTL